MAYNAVAANEANEEQQQWNDIYADGAEALTNLFMVVASGIAYHDKKSSAEHPIAVPILVASALAFTAIRFLHLSPFPLHNAQRQMQTIKALALLSAIGSFFVVINDPLTPIAPALVFSARRAREHNWISEGAKDVIETTAVAAMATYHMHKAMSPSKP